jgi:hypothetical protein
MSTEPTAVQRVQVPETPSQLQRLIELVREPEDADAATRTVGYQAYLFNPYLAAPADLTQYRLGAATFIPVQISDHPGGRKSMLRLEAGEEVLFGIYAMDRGLLFRYMKRLTGTSSPARTGDLYSTRLATLEGVQLVEEQAPIEVTGDERNTVVFEFEGPMRCRCVLGTILCFPQPYSGVR